jgi:hypothetical protein
MGLLLVAGIGFFTWVRWEQHFLSPEEARRQLDSHQPDYVRFVSLLQQDTGTRYIDSEGRVGMDSLQGQVVPQYRELVHKIGAKYVIGARA